jgi:hypothetical protein
MRSYRGGMTELEKWLEAERNWKLNGIAERVERQADRLSELAGGLDVTVEVLTGGDASIPKPSEA